MVKSRGPRTDPCGTPYHTRWIADSRPSYIICCVQPLRNDVSHCKTASIRPKFCSLIMRTCKCRFIIIAKHSYFVLSAVESRNSHIRWNAYVTFKLGNQQSTRGIRSVKRLHTNVSTQLISTFIFAKYIDEYTMT